ncbi:MAG: ABC transporter substrate-binding protein, partial [Oscillospiraceae bacterium]|nr:ABC transporter substrate-binding protein [Oscillospiraceae bacterium]
TTYIFALQLSTFRGCKKQTTTNVNGCGLCYDRLTYVDPYTDERVSNILEDWYYEDDLHLVLVVKEGVTFTDGTALTAEDIVYTFTDEIARGGNNTVALSNFDWDNAVVSDDGMTVTIPTFEEYAPGIISLSDSWIENEAYDDAHPVDDEAWWDTVQGTGPYYCVEQVDGAYSTYALRDNYWGEEEYEFDTVIIKYYSDSNALFIDYENGAIDVALNIGEYNYQTVLDGGVENTTVKMFGDGNPLVLCFDYDRVEAWSNSLVRQAVAHAIDLDALGIAGFDGLYKINGSFIPETADYYEYIGVYDYNVELAKELMEEAGYGDGFSVTMIVYEKYSALAEALQAQLAEINIDVQLDIGEMMPQLERLLAGEADATIIPTNTDNSGEPSNAFIKLVDVNNNILAAQVHDADWNALLTASYTMDTDARETLIKQIQQEFYDNVWQVSLVEKTEAWCYNNTVLSENFEAYVSGKSVFRVEKGT